jgi:predicted naringenin-chalcone synthase
MVTISHVTTCFPEYCYSAEEIYHYVKNHWFSIMDERTVRFAERIFNQSFIKNRYSVVSLEQVFADLSFQEKNDLYIETMKKYSFKLLEKFFSESDVRPNDIDAIITTSCTGFMIPSVETYCMNSFAFKRSMYHWPLTEVGCAGGTSSLILGHEFLKGRSSGKVLCLSIETPGLTLLKRDFDLENIVSSSLFADGASCVLLEKNEENKINKNDRPQFHIVGSRMYHFPQSSHYMGYNLTNAGLKIVLDKIVPKAIEEHLPLILDDVCSTYHLSLRDIEDFLFHPGGKKILQSTSSYLEKIGKHCETSQNIFQRYGNMSSSTIFYILKDMMEKKSLKAPCSQTKSMMLAFGPGFTAQSLVLEWK